MKKVNVLLLLIFILLMLCGCKNTSASDKSNDSVSLNEKSGIPVVSITTNNRTESAMDFVTKPIAGFVAEMIASWTPDYVMPPAPYYEECKITVTDADGRVTLSDTDAQVKVRGNWTTTYEKKPLRIKFAEKQTLLGLNDGAEMKNWVLLAEYKDGSMLRNKTILSIAEELFAGKDLYVTDTELVEVVINGEYWGVYLLAEYQQINEDRVNITEAEQDYTGTDIGYFLEFDGYAYTNEDKLKEFYIDYADNAPLVPFDGREDTADAVSEMNLVNGFTIKSDICSSKQRDFIASYVNNVYRILYAAAYEGKAYVFNSGYTTIEETKEITPQEAVERVVDTKSLAYTYIINEIACDADIYWSSFYMTVDFGEEGNKKLTFEAPWDFDSALGNRDRCADGTGFHAGNMVWEVNGGYQSINPWLAVLMHEDWFTALVAEQWTTAYDGGVFERAYAMIEEDMTQYSAAFERNYAKWNNIAVRIDFDKELSTQALQCRNQKEAAEHLLQWLKARVEFLNEYWHK